MPSKKRKSRKSTRLRRAATARRKARKMSKSQALKVILNAVKKGHRSVRGAIKDARQSNRRVYRDSRYKFHGSRKADFRGVDTKGGTALKALLKLVKKKRKKSSRKRKRVSTRKRKRVSTRKRRRTSTRKRRRTSTRKRKYRKSVHVKSCGRKKSSRLSVKQKANLSKNTVKQLKNKMKRAGLIVRGKKKSGMVRALRASC